MYNNSDYDSEDDDGYFLTPVLHYDISNKIIEANKILFDDTEDARNENIKVNCQTQRCVTFAEELVTFAPNFAEETFDPKEDTEKDDAVGNDHHGKYKDYNVADNDVACTKIIVAKELMEITNDVDTKMALSAVQEQQQQNLHNLQDNRNKSLLARDPPFHATSSTAATTSSSLQLNLNQQPKHVEKLDKIIDVEEDDQEAEEEVEEKLEMYNPKIPEDSSKSDEKITQIHSTLANNNDDNNDNDDDDDDSFSVQVGLIARKGIRREAIEKHNDNNNKKSLMTTKKTVKSLDNNRNNNCKNANIKFNYKICCEYAASKMQEENLHQQRLPEYRGLISEYGLSGEEHERLRQHKKRQERSLLEMEMRSREQMLKKLTANEQAFSTWLRNKCRQLPNRTRNMFDFNKNKSKNNSK